MPKLSTNDSFITRGKNTHNGFYTYEHTHYIKSNIPVIITCPTHGDFKCLPYKHLAGRGCRRCANARNAHVNVIPLDEALRRCKAVHGDVYDYSYIEYTFFKKKVKIKCNKCGSFFLQSLEANSLGQGCPTCGKGVGGLARKSSLDKVVNKAADIYGKEHYSFDKAVYLSSNKPITVTCNVHNKDFLVTPHDFIGKRHRGCPDCSSEHRASVSSTPFEEFVTRSANTHKEPFTYNPEGYKNLQSKISITCSYGHTFVQKCSFHIDGGGCPICWENRRGDSLRLTQDEAVKNCAKAHPNEGLSFEHMRYINTATPFLVTCKIHGDFPVTYGNFIYGGCGCPHCNGSSSKAEKSLQSFVISLLGNDKVICNAKNILPSRELDIYIPEKHLAIEYCGLYWHSYKKLGRMYHIRKMRSANSLGIRLITIFEHEWVFHPEIVCARLKSILGVYENHFEARKLFLRALDKNEQQVFFSTNHLQGFVASQVSLGLFNDTELVCAMSFGKPRGATKYNWELLRYASKSGCHIMGGASRLFSAFIKLYKGTIISYCDNRWSEGGLYKTLGFKKIKDTYPNYIVVRGGSQLKILNYRSFNKEVAKRELATYDDNISLSRNIDNDQKWFRVYDCAQQLFEYEAPPSITSKA